MSTVEEIAARHVSDGHRICYAQSLGPITVTHQFSRTTEAKILRCTQPLGHEGDHEDGNCCWVVHRFTTEQATKPEPEFRDTEHCKYCWQSYPCDVAKIRDLLPSDTDPAPFGYEYAIMPPPGQSRGVSYMLSPFMQRIGFYLARRPLESDEQSYGSPSDAEGWEKIS